jgi:hypothetical protein
MKRIAIVCAAAALAACSSDNAAPSASTTSTTSTTTGDTDTDTDTTGSDTLDTDSGTGGTAAPALTIDCGTPPMGAVGADYDHSPTAMGAEGPVTWQAMGLPMGMTIDPLSGALGGAPTEEGSFDVTITGDTMTQMGEAMCTIEVGPGLAVDLSGIGPCITDSDDLLALVTGGDGSPIVCDTPQGSGDGILPDGVSVDPDSCAIMGSSTETYGTWVWMTRLTQAGHQIVVPYCYTVTQQEANAYTITATHSGGMGDHLTPMVGTFTPGQDISLGGNDDPLFEVRGPCGTNSCFYGFAFFVGGSQFGDCGMSNCYGLDPAALIDTGNGPEGFSHNLYALGDPVDAGYEERPWVLSWELNYCISDVTMDCQGTDNIVANGNGVLRFGFIMYPE